MRPVKSYDEERPHLKQISGSDQGSRGVESRQKEMITFEPNDLMEPFEESEYTNEPGQEEYDREDRAKL